MAENKDAPKSNPTPGKLETLQIGEKRAGNSELYTKFIGYMRIIIPIGLLIIILMLFTWPQFENSLPDLATSDEEINVETAQNVLINPSFESLDNSERPYVINASKAELKGYKQSNVILTDPKGWLTLSKDRKLDVKANSGIYNQNEQTLFLKDGTKVIHSSGYELTTETIFVDLKNGVVQADNDVEIISGQNYLRAPALVMTGEGDHIEFKGPVKLLFVPGSMKDNETPATEKGTAHE